MRIPPILRNLLAVILGLIAGSSINGLLVEAGTYFVDPPPGADLSTAQGLAEAMELMELRHFVFPFLAHALGTFSGAWVAAKLSAKYRRAMGVLVGLFFFAGGVAMVIVLPSPLWFTVLDLSLAYFPMAYMGAYVAVPSGKSSSSPK